MRGQLMPFDLPAMQTKTRHAFPTVTVDGKQVCSICGKSRDGSVTVHGKAYHYDSLCGCDEAMIAKEREQQEKIKRSNSVEALKRQCIKEYHSLLYSFDNDDGLDEEHSLMAKMFVKNFARERSKGTGLLFLGKPGTGKTFMASCIANELINLLYSAVIVSIPYLIDRFRNLNERDVAFDLLQTADLVVLDDLGAEYGTGFSFEKLFQVVNCRYERRLPSIFTTNLHYDQLKHSQSVTTARIFDRIIERNVPCNFSVDRRETNRKALIKECKDNFEQFKKEL